MIDTVQNYVSSYSSEEGYGGRIEVVTGPTGRRRWPDHVKAAIVLESHRDGVSVADVARKHDVCQRRRKNLPVGRSKSRPLGVAPWGVMPSSSKHVPRRIGR